MKTIFKKTIVAILAIITAILMLGECETGEQTLFIKVLSIPALMLTIQSYIWFGLHKDKKTLKWLEED